ncbi:MAG: anaerobic ribonucleoside-triphosphate reductase activating protein [Bacteroidales bacterium]|nr:anaerobic ribonucleoside-triphosphate reductase activating protein [Bacteroidales bacterium]
MKIGGFLKQSLIDFPGKIASVIFTSGCNFRCFYCHNAELVLPELILENQFIDENEIFAYLKKNKQLLDAVVITGGEPTVQPNLVEFIRKIKELDLLVKLDTNGTNPENIRQLLADNLVDFIAMDIKSPLKLEKYQEIVGDQFSSAQLNSILESIELITKSNIKFEFRSTLVKPYHSFNDIQDMVNSIEEDYYLQEFRESKILNPNGKNLHSFNRDEILKEIDLSSNKTHVKFR